MAFQSNFAVSQTNPREVMVAEKKQPEQESAERLEVFIGKVIEVPIKKEDSGFFVAKMVVPKGEIPPKLTVNGRPYLGKNFTVVGVSKSFIERDRKNAEVECFGRWRENGEYGIQFEAQFVNEKLPNSPEALEAFLGSGKIKGLGPHFAKQIVDKWGVGAIEIIDNEPERLREIPGVGDKKLDTVIKSWKTFRGVYAIMSFMQMHGIGDAVGLRIFNEFGDSAIRMIEKNPYALTNVPMVGFRTADKIAKSLGVSTVAPFRISAALKFSLEEAAKNEGHTALPFNDLVLRASDLLELANQDPVADVLKRAVESNQLAARKLPVKAIFRDQFGEKIIESIQLCVSTKGVLATEKKIVEELMRLKQQPAKVSDDKLNNLLIGNTFNLDDSQLAALKNAFSSCINIITGGPGTGKTHTINAILQTAQRLNLQVLLTAPTGRAAKRMEESTGHKASTLHRLLGFAPDTGFKFNENNKLIGDLFIVDESSMIDIWLAYAFFKAVPEGATVILVGDVDQLPSVGAGNILSDLINSSQVFVSRLNCVHRQAQGSKIITNAHKIIKKQFPELYNREENFDFAFIEANTNQQIQDEIVVLCKELLLSGVNPNEIQIISPQKSTEVGTQELNKILRPVLNTTMNTVEVNLEDGSKVRFSVGDRVMQYRNNYELEIFNGDVGIVIESDVEDGSILVDFDGRSVALSGTQLKDIKLAYAITIHKSQGTEHPYVIIPMTRSHQFMFSPNLLYTAVTRGKKKVYLVGEKRVIYRTVSGINKDIRCTGLKEEFKLAVEHQAEKIFG